MLSAAKRNAPEPQVGSRTDIPRVAAFAVAVEGVPEGAEQFRPLALRDDVLGETLDVEIEGDEVVDVLHFARGEFGPDFLIALATGDDLAPCLRGQRVVVRRGGVPAAAPGYVVNPRGDVVREVERDSPKTSCLLISSFLSASSVPSAVNPPLPFAGMT